MHIRNFNPREYQLQIVETCKRSNTLVCIPTGLGKTKIAILLTIARLNQYENRKALILTPTRPLAAQITKEFEECTDIEKEKILLITGKITPNKRKELYENVKIVVATPQTIEEDIQNNRINLQQFSVLIIDEAHRSRENFANTVVARSYNEIQNGRILALTASPGSNKEKIEEIIKNLYIDAIEIRSDSDPEIAKYTQQKTVENIQVDLPLEMREIHDLIKKSYKDRMENVKSFIPYKPVSMINKLDLLRLQIRLQQEIKKQNNSAFYGMSLVAQLLKLNHAMEMLETQGLDSVRDFLNKLELETTKAALSIIKDANIINAKEKINILKDKNIEHPKILKLEEVIKNAINEKPDSRIIIFATYRNTVEILLKRLKDINIKVTKLVGQKEGLSQKEQIQAIEEFNSGMYNCLITTSIGEEGIHIGEAELAIFYDNTPSSIRKIQRSGRVGRLKPGKVIFMITRNTRDAAYFYKSRRDETKMKDILNKMKGSKKEDNQNTRLTNY